jgi:hypothetical protein
MPLPRSIASLSASSLFALCACVGTIERTPAEQTSVRTDAQTLEDVSAPPIVEGGAPPESEDTIPVTTRFHRLTHGQWEATTRDLLRLPEGSGLSSMFTPDAPSGTFDNNGSELRIGQQLWSDQQAAAEALARRVARDPARLAAIVPADAPMEPQARAQATIARFGLRAFRRPLTEDEVNAHLTALYDRGASLLGGEAFAAGIELVLRAMLQSPHFLYRVEVSALTRDGRVPLDDWELASRLSYALWGTMPDDALFEAAGRGELTDREGLRAQARRMLASPRAHAAVRAFHGQLYEWERFADVRRDPTRFPAWRETLPASMLREAELFVDDTVFAARGAAETAHGGAHVRRRGPRAGVRAHRVV